MSDHALALSGVGVRSHEVDVSGGCRQSHSRPAVSYKASLASTHSRALLVSHLLRLSDVPVPSPGVSAWNDRSGHASPNSNLTRLSRSG